MRITYFRGENIAGIFVGQGKKYIEIDFSNSVNRIISIAASNGVGKSVLLASLTPFASLTSLDERSGISYIRDEHNGYKEIHYQSNDDRFIIKHYYKANKTKGHTVKSYFQFNGHELNESGNVTSFLSLVELHFGLTPDMLRLLRIGTNVGSFISLKPTERKSYISKLISEIDIWLKFYKKINDDMRVLKVLRQTNVTNLHNCRISDIMIEQDKLKTYSDNISSLQREKESLSVKIKKIESLERENNVDELKRKRLETEASLIEFDKTMMSLQDKGLIDSSMDDLLGKRSSIMDGKVEVRSRINALKMSIDSHLNRVETLRSSIKKAVANIDLQSLQSRISELRSVVSGTDLIVVEFSPVMPSDALQDIVSRLSSMNQIGTVIYSFGNKPLELYISLRRKNKYVDDFLREQTKKKLSGIGEQEINLLLSKMFEENAIISPNCDDTFQDCPYYRLSRVIHEYRDIGKTSYDEETLKYLRVISDNMDRILVGVDSIHRSLLPEGFKDILIEATIINRLESKYPLFDITDIQRYHSLTKAYEIYQQQRDSLQRYEHELSIYQNSGTDSQMQEVQTLQGEIETYQKDIVSLEAEFSEINRLLEEIETDISLIGKYNDGKKYNKILKSSLESINKTLAPLENSGNEKTRLQYQLDDVSNKLDQFSSEHRILEDRINTYNRLILEGNILNDKYSKWEIALESVSTRKGLPLIYVEQYLGKIQKFANSLLSIVYGDRLVLGKFNVDSDIFEIPYIRGIHKVPDVKYGSQSEVSLITIALSFSLIQNIMETSPVKYNITLLDEIDAGLDADNLGAFLKMLHRQGDEINAEQIFIVSHSVNNIADLPMDVIRLSDIEISSRFQNVIYEG